jgi:hypothetical protein
VNRPVQRRTSDHVFGLLNGAIVIAVELVIKDAPCVDFRVPGIEFKGPLDLVGKQFLAPLQEMDDGQIRVGLGAGGVIAQCTACLLFGLIEQSGVIGDAAPEHQNQAPGVETARGSKVGIGFQRALEQSLQLVRVCAHSSGTEQERPFVVFVGLRVGGRSRAIAEDWRGVCTKAAGQAKAGEQCESRHGQRGNDPHPAAG